MFRVMSPKGYLQRPGLRSEVGEIIRPLASHIHILVCLEQNRDESKLILYFY